MKKKVEKSFTGGKMSCTASDIQRRVVFQNTGAKKVVYLTRFGGK